MTKTSSQEVLAIAQKFNLFEGKDQDFYLLHGRNVALTKMGAQKVTDALGIEFTNPVSTVGPNFIAFQAEFSDREGNKIHEVGSCRWDLAKPPSPEATHAAEMAWKRMVVRGVIKLAAPGVFSGEDEFTQDFRQYGPGGAPQAPPQQGYQQPPQAPRTSLGHRKLLRLLLLPRKLHRHRRLRTGLLRMVLRMSILERTTRTLGLLALPRAGRLGPTSFLPNGAISWGRFLRSRGFLALRLSGNA